jgi:hypothetical protein
MQRLEVGGAVRYIYIYIYMYICVIRRLKVKYHRLTEYDRVEVRLRAFLNSALDGNEWSPSSLSPFIPGKIAASAYRIGSWLRPRNCADVVKKRKYLLSYYVDQ